MVFFEIFDHRKYHVSPIPKVIGTHRFLAILSAQIGAESLDTSLTAIWYQGVFLTFLVLLYSFSGVRFPLFFAYPFLTPFGIIKVLILSHYFRCKLSKIYRSLRRLGKNIICGFVFAKLFGAKLYYENPAKYISFYTIERKIQYDKLRFLTSVICHTLKSQK